MTAPTSRAQPLPPTASAWLFKSEPETFSWQDLDASPRQTTVWEGVRNYQARNRLRDQVKRGDGVLFYHSACAEPGIVGVARVSRAAYPDPTQFEPASPYFDARASADSPRWWAVDVQLVFAFLRPVSRRSVLQAPELAHLELCRRGSRLSIQSVDRDAWQLLLRWGGRA